MKKILYSTTAFILCGIAQSQAACIPTPSCTSLGYTSTTSCTDGLKCPFGNYWNCTHINKITELTNKITEQTNKITELEKVIETSQSQGEICVIGSILYSDKSCYLSPQKGKTPIGVVVYVDGKGGGQALALETVGKYKWSTEYMDIPGLKNYVSEKTASKDYASCANSKIIMAAGNKSKYPAVWAAHEYKTEGTSAGDWCLPAAGIFTSYYNNQDSINAGFTKANGTEITPETFAWSTTEIGIKTAWLSAFDGSNGIADCSYIPTEGGAVHYNGGSKTSAEEVRPVLEF